MNREEFFVATPTQLADKTKVGKSQWSAWFNGHRNPSLAKAEEIAKKLDMPLGEFVEALRDRIAATKRLRSSDAEPKQMAAA